MSENQRYRVIKRLASGGMAEVFVAESAGIEGFRKQVAIKRVLPHLSKNEQFIDMFLDEARLSGRLAHSNVVSVFDIGVGDNTYFIVMEYVDGADLKQVIEHQKKVGKPMPVESACFIAAKICQGLAYAHDLHTPDGEHLNIVHRDVTPANVLITRHGECKIVDFGLAKASSQLANSDAGMIKGKFGYLAPETVMELGVDKRVDVFAAGIILWEMLAGRRLFLGETDLGTVKLVREANIPSLKPFSPDVPAELEEIIRTALARDRDVRYQTARDFGRDLTRFLYRFGRPVSEYEVADLVLGAAGAPAKKVDGLAMIGEMLDLMLLEFKSLTQADNAGAPNSLQPDLFKLTGANPVASPSSLDGGDLDDSFSGLSDELEGPDPTNTPQDKGRAPTAWWRGLISR
ncbi:serine/threonine-protein kinase [Polyangium sp. y55x31]|uniref:serine/threonine protein kinase n=1 Tax=Polyangium sp. y55x31 TaxID=3042688 RepID=UPI0024827983|nr:serine/threonine-protein kinase [Polyangium sp. y55x31]MDI1475271.1 serine/threonine-protein kinase [Polyangium sp. y55x31]